MCQERFRVERYFFGFDAGVRGSYPMYMFGVVKVFRQKKNIGFRAVALDFDMQNRIGWNHDEIH